MSNSDGTRRFKILANEIRWQTLRLLSMQPYKVGDIARYFNIEQSLMSHHLSLLKSESFVITDRKGKEVYYSINPQIVGKNPSYLCLGCCDIRFKD